MRCQLKKNFDRTGVRSYIDHINEKPSVAELQTPTNQKYHESFPIKLHKILGSELTKSGLIISWLPHGRAFMIHDKARFELEILGPLLEMEPMKTFSKQLNIFGFRRLSRRSGCDTKGYYHELFLSGREFLAYRIERRTKLKGLGYRKSLSMLTVDPDFYRLPPCFINCCSAK